MSKDQKKRQKEKERQQRIKEKQKYEAKLKSETDTLQNIRAKAPATKKELRANGCDLPFYDFLDSYSEEFDRIRNEALQKHPTLLDAVEVGEDDFRERGAKREILGYPNLERVDFEFEGEGIEDYGKFSVGNIRGSAMLFQDENRDLRTLIWIPKATSFGKFVHPEYKYIIKIAALCHEIGHVYDLEHGINFDIANRRGKIIDAEVFANLYALQMMAERNILQSYNILINGMEEASHKDGYLGIVGKRVLAEMPNHQLIDLHEY